GSSEQEAAALAEELAAQIASALGDKIYSRDNDSLEQVVGCLLLEHEATLAVAESCTGGLLAERITSVPGSSRYFVGGWVSYWNRSKADWLGVSARAPGETGAVSAEAARERAEGARAAAASTLAVAITGVAGPTADTGGGRSGPKPAGLVYIALADEIGADVKERQFIGDRERVRWQSSQ